MSHRAEVDSIMLYKVERRTRFVAEGGRKEEGYSCLPT